MDYSLLLGIHYRSRGDLLASKLSGPSGGGASVGSSGPAPKLAMLKGGNMQLLRPQNFAGRWLHGWVGGCRFLHFLGGWVQGRGVVRGGGWGA